jgi:transposase InsO family protein
MAKTRPPYPQQFKDQIVALVRSGRTPAELAREFEPSEPTIRDWVAQADRDDGVRQDGLTTAEKEELVRLRRENRQLRIEREILSKAAAWFARDITYIPTHQGFLFLAVVMDAWSRRIIGWSMALHLRTELVLDALEMALAQRRGSPGTICHSDHGSQYTLLAFGKRCREAGVRPSMGTVGDAYDNAMGESFFATLECELFDRRKFSSRTEARMAVFSFIEGWYNPTRRHSGLDYLSPMNYERRHMAET